MKSFLSSLSLALITSSLVLADGDSADPGASDVARHARQKPRIASGYFAGWHATNTTHIFGVSDIPWENYNRVIYAFVATTPDPAVVTLDGSYPEGLAPFVEAAHSHNVKAIASVGGWSESRYWSTAVGSNENRTTFVKTLTDFAVQYKLDGFDFDWEYPASQALGCNVVTPDDTANFVAFLKQLRQHPVGAKLDLSAAVPTVPYKDASGNPTADMSEFAKYLDSIMIMGYDIFGPWSDVVGPNAPLYDSCAPPAYQQGSGLSALDTWKKANVPAGKIVYGVPMYGHSYKVAKKDAFVKGSTTKLALYPPFDKSVRPKGDAWDTDADTPIDKCGNPNVNGGEWNMWSMVEAGWIGPQGQPKHGIPYLFDDCSKTAYVYRPETEIMISYDSPKTFEAKGKFIREQGLAGYGVWEIGGDYNSVMVQAIRKGAHFN